MTCEKSVANLEAFEKEHKKILLQHLKLEERVSRALFTLREKMDMMIDAKELTEPFEYFGKVLEVKVNPESKGIGVFQVSRYKRKPKK